MSLAANSAARVHPRVDRPVHLSTLAAECARAGQHRIASELFESARENLDSGGHPALRPAGLFAIASALHDSGETPEALKLSQEANALLAAWDDPSASAGETVLSQWYLRIGDIQRGRAIADRIENRGLREVGFSRYTTLSNAFRAYVGMNDFIAASRTVREGDLGGTAFPLFCSALDLWRETRVTGVTEARAGWLGTQGDRWGAVLAALMLWWSRRHVSTVVSELWSRVQGRLSDEDARVDLIKAASIASLALRRAQRVQDADALMGRLLASFAEAPMPGLDPLSQEYLARAFAAGGDARSAARIARPSVAQGNVNVAEGVISELVEWGNWLEALGLVETSDQQSLPRLTFNLAFRLLQAGNTPLGVESERFRNLQMRLDASEK